MPQTKATQIIENASQFASWWQWRNQPNDRAIVKAAVNAGLVAKGGWLIGLTSKGKNLRARGDSRRAPSFCARAENA
jgi:hypothetical protein